MNLTDTLLRTAKPTDKPYKLPRERGLFVIVYPNGSKLWRLAYSYLGKEKLLSLGPYPAVTLAVARSRREEAHAQIAAGLDPSAARTAAAARRRSDAENTFRVIAAEWLAGRAGALAPTTFSKAEWMLGLVLPQIGDVPVTHLLPPDILAALRTIEGAGNLETAHRVKARISEVFRYAIATGRAVTDPTRDLRGALRPKPKTQHRAAITEPKPLGALLRAIDGYGGTPEVCTALKLAPLLFVRPGELRAAQWPEFDLDSDAPAWRYFVRKTQTHHIVPLAPQAVALLRDLQPLTDRVRGNRPDAPRYVFPSARTRDRPMSENAVTAALRSLGYAGDQMTGHGFRATARTLLAEMDWNRDAIERQLAHKPSGPLGAAYDRAQHLHERRRMMTAWADYLDKLKRDTTVQATLDRAA